MVPEREFYYSGIVEYGRERERCEVDSYCITHKFLGKLRIFVGFYPDVRMESEKVWLELGAVRSFFNRPWVIAGNFNTDRFPFVKNCTRFNKAMADFF